MRDRYGHQERAQYEATIPRADGGVFAERQQPYNNVVRTAIQALAAVLERGAIPLHTNSLDEAYALPSEHAVTISAAHAAGTGV